MTAPNETGRISLMAAGELREAIAAHHRGDRAALASIDPAGWHAIEQRVAAAHVPLTDLANEEP